VSNADDPGVALRRARTTATIVLAVVAAVFAVTFVLPDGTLTSYLRAAAEAGLIGGLADWFAVTALFRHPLGIPIPHTAIIPSSKDKLGANLAAFMTENFLAPEVVRDRLSVADPAGVVGRWLGSRAAAEAVADHVAAALADLSAGVVDVWDDVEVAIGAQLAAMDVSEVAGRALAALMDGGHHDALVTAAVRGIDGALGQNRDYLRARLGAESPWWVPEALDDAVFDKAIDVAHRLLDEIASQDTHQVRAMIRRRLEQLAADLQHDPATQARVTERIHELIGRPEISTWLRQAVIASMGNLAAHRDTLATALMAIGDRLVGDDDLRSRVDGWIEALAEPLATTARRELAVVIPATVARWDAEETSGRLEAWMGRDLQFVRMNGTVVGALIGLVLHTIVRVLSG
jgi:uncharacterized membrane-anchored protein YjiN (DUF445 family)